MTSRERLERLEAKLSPHIEQVLIDRDREALQAQAEAEDWPLEKRARLALALVPPAALPKLETDLLRLYGDDHAR